VLLSLLDVVSVKRPVLSLVDVMSVLTIGFLHWSWDSQIALIWVLGDADLEALLLIVNLVHECFLDSTKDSIWESESDNSSNLGISKVALWWLANFSEVHLGIDTSKVDLIIGNDSVDVGSDSNLLSVLLVSGA